MSSSLIHSLLDTSNNSTSSDMSVTANYQSSVPSFKTSILVVGGAYAGLAAVKSFQIHLAERAKNSEYTSWFQSLSQKISITLVEPRAGLLNVLGMPRAIVDPNFAKSQYIQFQELNDLQFDEVISRDQKILQTLNDSKESNSVTHVGFELKYVHGTVTYLDDHKAQYMLNNDPDSEKGLIDFDYVVLATGRDRSWPTTPEGYTFDHFMEEMQRAHDNIEKHEIISVIGAGAVGIEIAGDIKNHFPDKTVNLIHPHASFPPEPLSSEFQDAIRDSLKRANINIITNTRIAEEKSNGDLITTTNETIKSELNLWCTSHKNNTSILSSEIRELFVTEKNDIHVNQFLQMAKGERLHPNFFVLGDLVNLPIIKSAGWAMYMGRQAANNITSMIFDHKLIEPFPDLTKMPRGMVIIAGNEEIVSELSGEVTLNHENYVVEYKDYCIGKVRATLGL